MSNLPSTLEEMQRDILQYDLSKNPYLQGSTIPVLDKELKTKSKKIIPAINELLNMVNTFSSGIETFMKDIQEEVNELKDEIKSMKGNIDELNNLNEEDERRVNELNDKYDECIKKAAEIELEVDSIKKACKYYNNLNIGEDFMELKSKIKLKKNESAKIIPVEELYDPEKQIKIYAYEEKSQKYKFINYTFKQQTSVNSIYIFDVIPIELQISDENSEVVLVNRSSWELIVLIFVK